MDFATAAQKVLDKTFCESDLGECEFDINLCHKGRFELLDIEIEVFDSDDEGLDVVAYSIERKYYNCTLLHIAIAGNNVKAARLLLEGGADPELTCGLEETTQIFSKKPEVKQYQYDAYYLAYHVSPNHEMSEELGKARKPKIASAVAPSDARAFLVPQKKEAKFYQAPPVPTL